MTLLAGSATSCTASRDGYDALVEQSRACDSAAGDTCEVVPTCGCGAAVNADDADTIKGAFESVDCCPPLASCELADCLPLVGAECDSGTCVATFQR